MTMSKTIGAVVIMALASVATVQAAVFNYAYVGANFVSGNGVFTDADSVIGTFSLDCATLPGGSCLNLASDRYEGNLAAVEFTAQSTPSTPLVIQTVHPDGFSFSTDSSGNLVDWAMFLQTSSTGTVIFVNSATGDFANRGGGVGGTADTGGASGVFSLVSVTGIPEIDGNAAAAAVALLLGFLGLRLDRAGAFARRPTASKNALPA
ncbi:MAG: hypothetical protein AAF458_22850 [Pseudomonadota bacterium]